jgi:hypothetical protein
LNDLVWTTTTPRNIELRARRDLSLHCHGNMTANSKILFCVRVAPVSPLIIKFSELHHALYLNNLIF